MAKKPYLLAVMLFLAIVPVVMLLPAFANAIDPESAAGSANYARDFQWLMLAKKLLWLATLLLAMTLWFLSCGLSLKSKGQHWAWAVLGLLGPPGFIVTCMLNDRAPASSDRLRQFVQRLNIGLRIAYEAALLYGAYELGWYLVGVYRELVVRHQAASRGVSVAQILKEQDASSGMWAFGEMLEWMYLVVLLYLLWPLVFNALALAFRSRTSANAQP